MRSAVRAVLLYFGEADQLLGPANVRHLVCTTARLQVNGELVGEGGQVVLTCSATGSPAPSIAWYKVGTTPHPPTVQITRLVRDPNYKKTDFSGRHM